MATSIHGGSRGLSLARMARRLARAVLMLALPLLSATAAWAQSTGSAAAAAGDGPYLIVQARYGTAQRQVDVTARLRELARSERSFRVENSLFGTDPHPDQVKSLRVDVRDRAGRPRSFVFAEKSVVDGGLFIDGTGGQGGAVGAGDYAILSARYGTAQRSIDVTDRLRDLAAQGQTFRLLNSTFGTDPDPGRVKTLRIYARDTSGRPRTFEYQEKSVVDGSVFSGWSGGQWGQGAGQGGWGGPTGGDDGDYRIVGARYGTAQANIDVTDRLRALAREDRSFRLENSLFGTDPHPHHVKTLRIYARDRYGHARTFEYEEKSVVDGSLFTGWSGGGWGQGGGSGGWSGDASGHGEYAILSARYGTAERHIDVTQRLRELARQDRTFRLQNATFGTDPDPGRVKVLRIYARDASGRPRTFEYPEKSVIDGSLFGDWSGGRWGQSGWQGDWNSGWGSPVQAKALEIVSARYGAGRSSRDVTALLRAQVREGRLSVRVDNDSLGGDPAPNEKKSLWVTWAEEGGRRQSTEVREGERLTLP